MSGGKGDSMVENDLEMERKRKEVQPIVQMF